MTRRAQAVYLIVLLAALVGLSRVVTGTFALPTGDASIWFHTGLLMLVLGIYWIEAYFTKPSDVVINGLVVFIATSTLNSPPNGAWWDVLRYFSLTVAATALLVVWAGSPATPGYDTSSIKRILYLVVIRLGSTTVLYSAVFVLSILSYFDSRSSLSRWLLAFWVVILLVRHIDLDGLVRSISATFRRQPSEIVGRLSRFSEPDIARFEIVPGADCSRGALVAFTARGMPDELSPLGVVIAHRRGLTQVEGEALLVDLRFAEGALDRRQVVVKADASNPVLKERLSRTPLGRGLDSLIGFASRDSDVSRLRFEMARGVALEEGYLVAAPSLLGAPILFQVVNGMLCEEASLESGERTFTVGDAQQLGTWDADRQGFSAHSWVVPENAPVVRQGFDAGVQKILKPELLEIGQIPSSSYPVNVNLHDLVLFHSAILGVTGSGKSFLAYVLVEKCAEAGMKVLCLDLTGDYQRYVRGAVRLTSSAAIAPFLADAEHRIGIVEFTESGVHPIVATRTITQSAVDWCRKNRSDDEIRDPKPKVLLVLEEAHSLVPEWNSNPVPNLRDTVNATAQIGLQARKYGLGMLLITQRTANVTKSILNQCNTIFAFQAYDETGFEFMKNYMGLHYVQALPNLKKRQGVVVGKGSASDRPVIVRFHDQERQPAAAELPAYVVQKPGETVTKGVVG